MSGKQVDYNERIQQGKGSLVYVYLIALVAALGGLLFGYDTAVISGAIGFLETRFDLNPMMKGWTASSAIVGCIIGACFAGILSDWLGRKKVMILSAVLLIISAVGSAIPRDLTEFIIARIIGGVGVGAASMLSPLYIAEVAPAQIRGRLVSLNQLAVVSGALTVYFVNAIIAHAGDNDWNVAYGWRWMFGSEMLPAVLFISLLFFIPESPRWLLKEGRDSRALDILSRVGGGQHARVQIRKIKEVISHEKGSIFELFERGFRLALVVGIGLALISQITGMNVISYYAPEIFKDAGLKTADAIGVTVIVGAINLAATILALWVIDKIGRKPLLLMGTATMGFSLAFLAVVLHTGNIILVLCFILVYVAAFAVTLGPVVWVLIAEIFPTRIRGRAMSIATVFLWGACFAVSQTFPVLMDLLSERIFLVYAGVCLFSFSFIWSFVPETKGKSLEEIEESWKH